ncbi:9331_t:CDS:2, partial [Racocetra persica]
RVTEAKMKQYALPPKKKNIQPPNRKRNINYIGVERMSNHSNADETYDNTQDSFNNNNVPEPNNLTTTDPSQDNTTTTNPTFSQDNTAL